MKNLGSAPRKIISTLGFVALLAAVLIIANQGEAAPPPGGFAFELVIDAYSHPGKVKVFRFRDGPRVCYVASAENAADTISCVVSP